ncbi:MAG: hypothetical protein LUQ47_03820 [Methanotrichaceae archaeon]|nr:hypothetical protein [Methanotrichaceae archaeon]
MRDCKALEISPMAIRNWLRNVINNRGEYECGVKSMKIYLILAALVLGLFGGIVPSFGEIMIDDNVTFLTFDEGGESGLNNGTVLDISEDGDWLLIYVPPDYLPVVSKWFIYSDETMVNQLLTKLLMSGETYGPTGGD